MLPGEHLRVRQAASIFPPSPISNGHREPSPRTSEKAGQLASLFETGGSTARSQQPSKQPVPSPGLQSWQRTRFTNSCASTGFSTPEARGTGNPAISNSASYPGAWLGKETDKAAAAPLALLGLARGRSAHRRAAQDRAGWPRSGGLSPWKYFITLCTASLSQLPCNPFPRPCSTPPGN